jgi:hypothetical protein
LFSYNAIVVTAKFNQIGQSMRVRKAKANFKQTRPREKVEIERFRLVVRGPRGPRAGWDAAFARAIAKRERDIDADWLNLSTRFDSKDWKW